MLILNIVTLAALLQAALVGCNQIMIKKPVIEPIVCPCEYKFQPVCGSDGLIYMNDCILECYNKGRKRGQPPITTCIDGFTCAECKCAPQIPLPVCTTDGKTYANECEWSCENYRRLKEDKPLVYLAYRKACYGPPCKCSKIASPVCGTDNVLYRNLCELNCARGNAKSKGISIEMKNIGDCLDECSCPDIKEPVCGSDGVEYQNLCQITCENRKRTCSVSGPITPAPEKVCKPCSCPFVYKPVCGTADGKNFKTFPNICELNCEVERTGCTELRAVAFGVCSKCPCTGKYQPVCGTDCKTYTNECELRCANSQWKDISMLHPGPCIVRDCDCSHCPTDQYSYKPVCGSDGNTYWSSCWLTCNSNCCKSQNSKPITMVSKGSCKY